MCHLEFCLNICDLRTVPFYSIQYVLSNRFSFLKHVGFRRNCCLYALNPSKLSSCFPLLAAELGTTYSPSPSSSSGAPLTDSRLMRQRCNNGFKSWPCLRICRPTRLHNSVALDRARGRLGGAVSLGQLQNYFVVAKLCIRSGSISVPVGAHTPKEKKH